MWQRNCLWQPVLVKQLINESTRTYQQRVNKFIRISQPFSSHRYHRRHRHYKSTYAHSIAQWWVSFFSLASTHLISFYLFISIRLVCSCAKWKGSNKLSKAELRGAEQQRKWTFCCFPSAGGNAQQTSWRGPRGQFGWIIWIRQIIVHGAED